MSLAIPICPGLTIVTAVNDAAGDYETIKTVQSVGAREIRLKVSAERRVQSVIHTFTILRTVLQEDMKSAPLYMHYFDTRAPLAIDGSTALGPSSTILRALKTFGRAELGIVEGANSALPSNRAVHPNVYDFQEDYRLTRVGTATVPVTVNGVKTDLPAIHAQADYIGDKAEFFFLDDENNPLTLRYRFAAGAGGGIDGDALRLQAVNISYRCGPADRAPAGAERLERALLEQGRTEVYDIRFDFDSDRIREGSESTVNDIADVMRRHPDWKLAVEGHTDGIASDSYNLELSRRRAAAVKLALVTRYAIAAERLSTAGFGESRPKDRNDTLEGRARNRRVELVRQ